MIDITIILKALGYMLIGVVVINVAGYIVANEASVDPEAVRMVVVPASFIAGVIGAMLAIK